MDLSAQYRLRSFTSHLVVLLQPPPLSLGERASKDEHVRHGWNKPPDRALRNPRRRTWWCAQTNDALTK